MKDFLIAALLVAVAGIAMTCFWKDKVNVAEDCTSPPVFLSTDEPFVHDSVVLADGPVVFSAFDRTNDSVHAITLRPDNSLTDFADVYATATYDHLSCSMSLT